MEFSNLFFLYLFLPLCVGVYYLAPGMRMKNGILILFSLLFYCLGRPIYVFLLIGMALLNYYLPKLCRGRLSPILSISLDVAILLVFKTFSGIPFPMGISFYVFSLISYHVDVYRDEETAATSFWHFLLFISFFPKMVMGPIVRYSKIAPQLTHRCTDPKSIFRGCLCFIWGLGKKILLADPLFRVYEQLGNHSSRLAPWIGAMAFMLYIFFEFSGYSDMAVGLGRMFGFDLPGNFNRPYTASSISDFWRRWHITLGEFFRDYVYIPLGGNRKGVGRQSLNLWIVWLLTGIWHGFSLTFALWGLYFFVLVSGEKLLSSLRCKLPHLLQRGITFALVYFGWIIFAAEDLRALVHQLGTMFYVPGGPLEPTLVVIRNSLPVLLLGLALVIMGPLLRGKLSFRFGKQSGISEKILAPVLLICGIGILVLCTVALIGSGARPSMYAGF